MLILRGAEVYGTDIVDADTPRPQWLSHIGGKYIDGRQTKTTAIADASGKFDLIFEATGIAQIEFDLLDGLARNGVYVLTGIPGGDRPIQVPGADLIRQLVLNNQVMIGSVNAARAHFQMGIDDLYTAHLRWGAHMDKLITNHYSASDFDAALHHHTADEIKVVVDW